MKTNTMEMMVTKLTSWNHKDPLAIEDHQETWGHVE